MRRRDPAHRGKFALTAPAPPEHEFERALYELVHTGGTDETVSYAYEIYSQQYEREAMQAWIVAGADDDHIKTTLGIPTTVSIAYRHLFFDMTVFRDKLDLMGWVREYGRNATAQSQEGAALLQTAMMRGIKALIWIYGGGDHVVEIDPQTVLRHAMADGYFRGQAGRMHGLTSKETHVAQNLMNNAVKIATVLDKKKAPSGNALAIKLRYRECTTPVHEIDTPETPLLH